MPLYMRVIVWANPSIWGLYQTVPNRKLLEKYILKHIFMTRCLQFAYLCFEGREWGCDCEQPPDNRGHNGRPGDQWCRESGVDLRPGIRVKNEGDLIKKCREESYVGE